MSSIDEMIALIDLSESEDSATHYGMPRRSGRYPWGSGEDPYQRTGDLLGRVEALRKEGWSETPENIKEVFGMTTTEYRKEISIAKNERRRLNVERAKSLQSDGLGPSEIGRKMGVSESTVRSWLNEASERRMNRAQETADFIRKQIDTKGMIDVGTGVELELGCSREKLNAALKILEKEGYPIYKGGIPQVTNPGKQINQMVICPPGTEHKEIYNYDKVNSLKEYITRDGGETYEKKFTYPSSMDSSRLMIRYAEEGGLEKDGVMQIRRGCEDLSLGNSRYSQVRILVDNDRYLKGMAVYGDDKDFPPGVDVIFNTNKHVGTPMRKVLKEIKNDPENPFGSAIKDVEQGGQYWYTDSKTGEKKLGLINKRADEGDWGEWANKIPSQFLSKQSIQLAEKQLNLSLSEKKEEYEKIMALTNPTLKKSLLQDFADDCDASAVHLKAAALPGQKFHVIIPMTTLKDDEIYAPNYPDGTELALVRYPHGGTFEIPICKVNNKNKEAIGILGKTVGDAVGINSHVAERLSGADFDGDTVMTIPANDAKGRRIITSTNQLKGLEGFDSKSYKIPEGDTTTKRMHDTQKQMGVISNLITDMTLKGASPEELARAVRHSMVVIDAEKHGLDYKQSEIDNNIAELRRLYQKKVHEDGTVTYGGASTLLSRAKGEHTVNKRQGSPKVNLKGTEDYDPNRPEGALIWKDADDLHYEVKSVNKRTGEITTTVKTRTQKSTNMAETDDARTLISDFNTPMENAYAKYANSLKSLANSARVEISKSGNIAYSKVANQTYKEEVKSLNEKLQDALSNAPRERKAQLIANAKIQSLKEVEPDISKADLKKKGQKALSAARAEVGAKRNLIDITDKEWEAIQSGAISESKLSQILKNTDKDKLRERATPRENNRSLNEAKINRMKAMAASNYTLDEIAKALGVSTSTVSGYLKGGK